MKKRRGPLKKNLVNDFICTNLRRIRLEKGLRVQEIASRSGIPVGSYSCLETGRYRLNLENLYRILQVLGVPIQDVWPTGAKGPASIVDDAYVERLVREAAANRPRELSIEDVVEVVCQTYGVAPEELTSSSRRRDLAEARAVASVLTREIPHLSLAALSRRLGRDMSSLSHCVRRFRERLRKDWRVLERVHRSKRALDSLQEGLERTIPDRAEGRRSP